MGVGGVGGKSGLYWTDPHPAVVVQVKMDTSNSCLELIRCELKQQNLRVEIKAAQGVGVFAELRLSRGVNSASSAFMGLLVFRWNCLLLFTHIYHELFPHNISHI